MKCEEYEIDEGLFVILKSLECQFNFYGEDSFPEDIRNEIEDLINSLSKYIDRPDVVKHDNPNYYLYRKVTFKDN